MIKIYCDRKNCIHNTEIAHDVTVCERCDEIIICTYHNSCNGYENKDEYLKRINNYAK